MNYKYISLLLLSYIIIIIIFIYLANNIIIIIMEHLILRLINAKLIERRRAGYAHRDNTDLHLETYD